MQTYIHANIKYKNLKSHNSPKIIMIARICFSLLFREDCVRGGIMLLFNTLSRTENWLIRFFDDRDIRICDPS